MTITTTDSSVIATSGRGKNKTVVLDVSFDALEKWAKRMQLDTKKLLNQSFGRACSGLKKRLVKIMEVGGGVDGIPQFKDYEAFTTEFRRIKDMDPTGPIGGVLADKRRIVAFKRDGWQYVGWPDRLADVANKFQDGRGGPESESRFTDPEKRAKLHRRGIKDVPRSYVHNERAVMEPHFHQHIVENLEKWARGAFHKELANLMMKARAT